MRGIGSKSPRTEALDLHKQGWRPERIAAALGLDPEQVAEFIYGKPKAAVSRTQPRRRSRTISEASPAQRAKVKDRRSITGTEGPCDPAHIAPRSLGGCDDALCIVPLTRAEHRAFDSHELDLMRYLVPGYTAELQHALGHYRGDVIALLERITSDRWVPRTTGGPE